ncbi:carbohydrate binding domain-containing protein [Draconibacterium sp. IB214405]|uniref:carbohydrate binding domain-containing protein n=1 Tax=Draconibacterium sp. IB214405 TaxID=3097352 RepID=UPI002A11F71B|nr:carbohydrate binding domain-containing protein [Draconibacterium sp. IB214405]MDX8339600.1 carbohydrate binding domain-containing protein [Draconibacterium sp. IB214405]
MKEYFKYLIISIMAVAVLTTGCQDEDDIFGSVTITGISVESAFINDPVSIDGTNFNLINFVFVGERQAEFTLDGNTVTFNVPEGAKVGQSVITLVMNDNYRETIDFEVLLRPVPVIQSLSSNAVASGEELVIQGLSLNSEYSPEVMIGDVVATINSATPTSLTVVVPAGLPANELAEIEITTIHGSTKSNFMFYAGENLITNGNFEAGEGDEFTNWSKLNGGDGMTAISGDDAYYGRSVRVVGAASNPWNTQFATDPIDVVAGTEYTVVLWAKGEADGAVMRVSVSQWPEDYFYGGDVSITTEWAQYTWTFTGQELPNGSKIVLDMGTTNVPFAIDNVTLIAGAGGSLGAPELLTNASFEDDLTGWETLNGTFNISTAEAYCGSKSLEAIGSGGNYWDVQIASSAIELEAGTQYELGFWAKAAGADGIMRVSCSRWASGQADDFFYSPDVTVATDWTYYSFVFTAQTTSTGNHQIVMDFGKTTQTFYIDAVSLKEYEEQTSLYANGGFEEDLTGWEVLNGAATATTDDAHSGSKSLTVTGTGGNPWDVQIAANAVALTVDQKYKVSFWGKAAGPDGVMRLSASRWASGQADDFFYSPDITIATDWTYYSFVFTAGATSTGDHHILLDMGASTQTFFIDDVVVTEYESPCE